MQNVHHNVPVMNKVFHILCVASLALACGCGRSSTAQPRPLVVRCESVQPQTSRSQAQSRYIGRVKGDNETDLSFKVGGILELIGPASDQDWQEGAEVKKGQRLARLKQDDFLSEVKSAAAKRELNLRAFERAEKLLETKAISPQEFDTFKAARDASEAALELARQALRDSELLAPYDGTVLARTFNAGQTVSAGRPVLRYADLDLMSVELGVPDTLIDQIKVNQEYPVTLSGQEYLPPCMGHVTEVGVAAKEGARLYKVVLKVPNEARRIKSGMTALVSFESTSTQTNGVLVPLSALVSASKPASSNSLVVFVVGEDNVAHERPIITGDIIRSSIMVSQGLQAGERVVVAGASTLYDGAPVKVLTFEER